MGRLNGAARITLTGAALVLAVALAAALSRCAL